MWDIKNILDFKNYKQFLKKYPAKLFNFEYNQILKNLYIYINIQNNIMFTTHVLSISDIYAHCQVNLQAQKHR